MNELSPKNQLGEQKEGFSMILLFLLYKTRILTHKRVKNLLIALILMVCFVGLTFADVADYLDFSIPVNTVTEVYITGSGEVESVIVPSVNPGEESAPRNITIHVNNNSGTRWHLDLKGNPMVLKTDANTSLLQSDISGLHFFHNTQLNGTQLPTYGSATYIRTSNYQYYTAADNEFNVSNFEVPIGLIIKCPATQTAGDYETLLTFSMTN